MTEFNTLIERVNQIIDKLNEKIEIEEVIISREVKDFKFFNWEEHKLPYHTIHTLTSVDDVTSIFDKYAFSYKEMKQLNDLISSGKIISLVIDVTEEITEKEEKQEVVFETVETVDLSKPIKAKKKRGRPKKKKSSRGTVG